MINHDVHPGSVAPARSSSGEVISSAAREAAGDTLRAFVVPVAAVISLVVGVVLLLTGQSPVSSTGWGVVTLLSILAAFLLFFNGRLRSALAQSLRSKDTLLNERQGWEDRVGKAETAARDRDTLATDLQKARTGLEVAEARISASEAERAKMTGSLAALTQERDDLAQRLAAATSANASLSTGLREAQAAVAASQAATEAEKRSTTRAPMQPLIRPSVEIAPGGFLKPKVVRVAIENIGQGNATDIQVNGGAGVGTAAVPRTDITYIPALKPGETVRATVGNLPDFSSAEWFGVQITYVGPFGDTRTAGIRRSFR